MNCEKCEKCGALMTPTVLFTSTVYDCLNCDYIALRDWALELHQQQKDAELAEHYGVTLEQLQKVLGKANARTERSEGQWLTKAEALASGPGPYEQGFSGKYPRAVPTIPPDWLDKGEGLCLGWRRKGEE